MNKRKLFILISLFLLVFLSSCSKNPSILYKKGKTTKALEVLDQKKNLDKNDYLLRIRINNELGNDNRNDCLAYLMLCDNLTDERALASKLFTELNFNPYLNILCLLPSDGINAKNLIEYSQFVIK